MINRKSPAQWALLALAALTVDLAIELLRTGTFVVLIVLVALIVALMLVLTGTEVGRWLHEALRRGDNSIVLARLLLLFSLVSAAVDYDIVALVVPAVILSFAAPDLVVGVGIALWLFAVISLTAVGGVVALGYGYIVVGILAFSIKGAVRLVARHCVRGNTAETRQRRRTLLDPQSLVRTWHRASKGL